MGCTKGKLVWDLAIIMLTVGEIPAPGLLALGGYKQVICSVTFVPGTPFIAW